MLDNRFADRTHVLRLVTHFLQAVAFLGRGIDNREVQQVVRSIELDKEVKDLVDHPVDPGRRLVDLVDHHDDAQIEGQRLLQHKVGLRHRPFLGIDHQQHAIDHPQHPFDLAAEIGVPGRVDDVDPPVMIKEGAILAGDGDAALFFQIHRVHQALGDNLIVAEHAAVLEQLVDQGGLAVVNVRDDGDIANLALVHG